MHKEDNGVRKRLGFVPSDDEEIESDNAQEVPPPPTKSLKPSPLGLQIDFASSQNDTQSEKSVVCVDESEEG